jgi:hypothetical protein
MPVGIRTSHTLIGGEIVEIAAALPCAEIMIGESAASARTLAQNLPKVGTHEVPS